MSQPPFFIHGMIKARVGIVGGRNSRRFPLIGIGYWKLKEDCSTRYLALPMLCYPKRP